jgi:hypothetical protein
MVSLEKKKRAHTGKFLILVSKAKKTRSKQAEISYLSLFLIRARTIFLNVVLRRNKRCTTLHGKREDEERDFFYD